MCEHWRGFGVLWCCPQFTEETGEAKRKQDETQLINGRSG